MTNVEILRGGRMKKGDTLPSLRAKLFESGDPFNLDGWTVEISIKRTDADSPTVDSATATVEQPNRGIVTYDWQSGNTDTSGTYLLEFVADDGSGSELTFPNKGRATIYIQDRIQ